MIATILPSSASFYAVEYNERKVSQGKAELLEMTNFGYVGNIGTYTCDELTKFLTDYSSSNKRIEKPQFHVAISCKGHEYTKEELVAIAHQYMREMGYGEMGSARGLSINPENWLDIIEYSWDHRSEWSIFE